jgi:hypothetical protein
MENAPGEHRLAGRVSHWGGSAVSVAVLSLHAGVRHLFLAA